jgi:hypothetical protein
MKLFLRLAFAVALLGLCAAPASAQYMFLDANGDAAYDASLDRLNPNGTPTTVDVYLITNQNRDGSTAVCDADGISPLSINSYVINLEAAGGTVTYANFINQMGAAFATNFGELNAGDGLYKNGNGAQLPVEPGKYKLATITITGNTGAPSINIVDMVATATDFTGFGTGAGGCVGHDFDNTYKLTGPHFGTDWTDVDGLAPAPGGNAAPTLTVNQNVTAIAGQELTIEATATDPNPADVITITEISTAPFLTNFSSTPGPSPVTATLSGTPAVDVSGVFLVTWIASDNVNPPDTVLTTVTVTPAGSNQCPVLAPIGDKTVTELTDLTFTAVGTDADVGQTLTYSLGAGAPPGAAIDPNTGFFTWTPNESQGPGSYAILVQVTDNSLQPCTDTETITVTVLDSGGGGNQCPVLTAIGSQTVTEGNLLTFTATATDPDAGQTLTFSLDPGFPAGSSINSSTGVFTWTPAVDQGPATYPITVRVTDSGKPSCSDSEEFLVTVNDSPGGNLCPVLSPIGNQTVTEGTNLTFTATATDANSGQVLTFSLGGTVPAGASINSSTGVFNWNPTPDQGPGTYPIAVRVSDNAEPACTDSEIVTVTVNDSGAANQCPVLTAIGNQTVTVGNMLTFTAAATDPDVNQTLTFSLDVGFPTGATINSQTGAFAFTPTADQAGTQTVTVRVTDSADPSCSDFETIEITVNPVVGNVCPVLNAIGDQTATVGNLLTFTATATDPDAGQTLTFTLDPGFPTGASINSSTGVFSYTPTAGQEGTQTATVRVTDSADPSCSDFQTVNITVNPTGNTCPVLTSIGNRTVDQGNLLTFTATATDPDASQALTYTLDAGAPAGAVINPSTGVFSWTPASSGGFPITIRVTDSAATPCSDFETITVTVNPLTGNACPVLAAIGNKTVTEGNLLTFTATATDADAGQILTFTLDPGFPTGASINSSTGVFSWTPTLDQGPGTYSVTVRVTDNADPSCADFETISVTVNDSAQNQCPVLNAIGNRTVTEGNLLTFTAAASDPDAGQTLTFSLDSGFPTGASINSSTGVFSFTPTSDQGPGTYTITVRVTDNGNPSCSDFETITVTVNDSGAQNQCPVLNPIGNQFVTVGNMLTFTATASDADAGQTLTFTLDPGAPAGASIGSSTGIFTWTPAGTGSFPITVRVTDSADPSCSDFETIVVTVTQGGGGGVTYNTFFTGGNKKTRLWTGKPTTCVQLEVVGAENSTIDLNSLVLVYNGQQISATSADLSRDTDRDGNGEVEACFSKGDLRTLFDGLPTGESTVTATLQGMTTTGQAFSVEVTHDVVVRGNEHAQNGEHGKGQGNGQGGDHGQSGDHGNGGNVGNGGSGGGDDQGDDDQGDDVADNSGNDDGGTTRGNGNGNGQGQGQGQGGSDKGHGRHALAKPNPLNPATVLEFTVARTGPVRVQVFNATGRLVKALYEGTMQEGRNTLGWDGSTSTGTRVASGVYYFRIVTAESSEVVRVTVLK